MNKDAVAAEERKEEEKEEIKKTKEGKENLKEIEFKTSDPLILTIHQLFIDTFSFFFFFEGFKFW